MTSDVLTTKDTSKFAVWLLGLICAGAITWCGWMTKEVVDKPTIDEVRHLIETSAPYVKDKGTIEARLDQVAKLEDRLSLVIDRNTEAINALRVEIAKMEKR